MTEASAGLMLWAVANDLEDTNMVIAADYPFLDIFWTMLVFVGWIIWLFLLIRVISDVFRSQMGGFHKVLWIIFVIILPFLGVFIYLIVHGKDMGQRDVADQQAAKASFDDYVRTVTPAGGAAEIAKAKELLDSGAITQAEFDALKAKAVA
jgi:hypothetical protein